MKVLAITFFKRLSLENKYVVSPFDKELFGAVISKAINLH